MATEAHVVADILKHSEERSKKILNEYQTKCKEAGIEHCKAWTKSGVAGEAICETAHELHADMILLGSRGLGTVRRTILGSVSDYVLHHAHIPVLIVPKK
ncbi:unnamed protein product [Owenia fusiformis]|nr:unnamed protein product [Owenia fusiformis]